MLGLALPFSFEHQKWLWLWLLVPVMVVVSWRGLVGLEPTRRVLALVTRSVLFILVISCLAGVQFVLRSDELAVIFLMDRSHSVGELTDHEEQYVIESTQKTPPSDRVGLIDFARFAYVRQMPTRGGYMGQEGRLPPIESAERTDVAGAVRLAMALFPSDAAKRIVLLSDGNDNVGDLLAEARRAKADGVPVDVVPLRYQRRNEVYFDRLIAPSHAEEGEQLSLRMVLGTNKRVGVAITLYQDGRVIEVPEDRSRVELAPGSNTLVVKLPANAPGVHTYDAVFRPDSESLDGNSANNSASAFTIVSGSSKALLLTEHPDEDQPLLDALRSENLDLEMKTPTELGTFSLLQMSNYSAILLSNIPAATFTDEQQHELAVYVKDLGGGLIMLGGEESFGAGGWIDTPVEEVMPVTFEIKHKRVLPKGALVLIMHSCEIPRGNYYGKEMAKKSVDTVSSQDLLGVLAFSFSPGGTSWEVPLDANTNKAAVKAKIDRMQIGDMPDFGSSLQMAYDALTKGKGKDAAQKHVIITSDGDPQPPSDTLLKAYADAKITVSTIGIGWGAHVMTPTMKHIAESTGGKFYDARNPKQLPQIFVKESKVVRRPLIVEEPFQPQLAYASSELLAGLEPGSSVPPLGGLVLTSPKTSPNVFVSLVRATTDGDDPVLAHWQCELGKTVAFTSGAWPRWGQNWVSWSKFAKFWAQIVRWTMRQEAPANFDVYTKVEGNRGRIVINALSQDARYLNLLQLDSKVVGPDNNPLSVNFVQTGPGHYEAEFEADIAGHYLASVQVSDQGRFKGTIRTGVSIPFSPEYRDLKPNEALLRQVAETTGGRWLDKPASEADLFGDRPPPVEA
ncbi:MAG: VWA domain-containing protein [Planctomycetota bacterium]